jgi:hypothetical protein
MESAGDLLSALQQALQSAHKLGETQMRMAEIVQKLQAI